MVSNSTELCWRKSKRPKCLMKKIRNQEMKFYGLSGEKKKNLRNGSSNQNDRKKKKKLEWVMHQMSRKQYLSQNNIKEN